LSYKDNLFLTKQYLFLPTRGGRELHTFLFWVQDVGQWSVSCTVLVSIRGKTLDKRPRWCGVLAKENNPEPYRKLPVLTRSFPRTVNRIHCPVRVIFSHIYLCGASGQIGPRPPYFWSFGVTHNYTQTPTPGSTPLNEWWARCRGRYLGDTQQTKQTNIYALSGIRASDPCNRMAADLRLRAHGHRDRLLAVLV